MPDTTLLSPAMTVTRVPGLIEAEIDNEVVALNIETGVCYGLNRVGSKVWSLVESPAKIGDVCEKLLSEFEVDRDVCEREVLEMLEELRSEGLIAVSGEK